MGDVTVYSAQCHTGNFVASRVAASNAEKLWKILKGLYSSEN